MELRQWERKEKQLQVQDKKVEVKKEILERNRDRSKEACVHKNFALSI